MNVQKFIDLYHKSRNKLTEIIKSVGQSKTLSGLKGTTKKVEQVLNGLFRANKDFADIYLVDIDNKAVKDSFINVKGIGAVFGRINRDPIEILRLATKQSLDKAVLTVGRQIKDDVLRQKGLMFTLQRFNQNLTTKESARLFAKSLFKDNDVGFGRIQVSSKRTMRIDSYAELVARTTSREVTNLATILQGQALGYGLVKMSEHNPTCEICASLQGRVYRTVEFPSGDWRQRFPYISNAMPGYPMYWTVHPNCRHVLSTTVEDLWDEKEKTKYIAEASKPFGKDPRSQKETQLYTSKQVENRQRLADRKQYERYKIAFGDSKDMPKTFSGFRSMKKARSERFINLESDYKSIMRK